MPNGFTATVDSGYSACKYSTRVPQCAAEVVPRTLVTKEPNLACFIGLTLECKPYITFQCGLKALQSEILIASFSALMLLVG